MAPQIMNPAGEPTRVPIVFGDVDAEVTAAVSRAITAARAAQSRWSRTPPGRRLELIRELRRLIAEHAPELARASAFPRQRPALESLTAEVLPLAEACRFLERNAGRILAPRRLGRRGLPLWLAGVRSEIHREPLGVVLIIGPGNYPLMLPGVQMIQALAAGNAVLLKPGIGGTGAARALTDLIIRAGFDSNLVALLPESPEAARAAIVARPDKVLFTGSAATGETILAQLAPHLIPAAMELSGCDAVILRADADVALAVRALVFALTLNGGATCLSPKRVFVSAARATELEGRLARALSAFGSSGAGETCQPDRSGGRLSPSAAAPPGSAARARLLALVEEAEAGGAHCLAGSETRLPIVLAAVPRTAGLLREDIFAPVLSVVTVGDDDEAVMLANDCPFALTASIFSRDESAARPLAARLNAGVVTINDLIIPSADARVPFGGRGRSGFGVTRGAEGLLELTTPKVVTVSRGRFRPAFDPPQPGDEVLFNAYLKLAHGRGFKSRCGAMVSLIRSISRRPRSSPQENP
jgi:acyl-CoA reductase-like NAD-dependent aldehyde dehydrogenase